MVRIFGKQSGEHIGYRFGEEDDPHYIEVTHGGLSMKYFITCKALGIKDESLCEATRNEQEVAHFVFHRIRKEFQTAQTILHEVWPHCYPGQNTPLVL